MTNIEERKQLLGEAEKHDGVAPFSEAFVRGLEEDLGHRHFERRDNGELVGLAALAPDGSAELAVRPAARRRGHGTALVRQVLAANDKAGLWAHGNVPAAQEAARALSLRVTRELLVMGIGGSELQAAAREEVPAGYEALNYEEAARRWGRESVEQQWLAVNNDAFSWHPEQRGWDLERLHQGMDTDWFDPAGVWFIYQGEDMAGFHWTKVHPDGVGEVYVVGLASEHRGRGLGGPLLSVGLNSLVEQGLEQVILYVEADNEPAVRRYRQMGFAVRESHVVYVTPTL
ncbi:mycothiol synthase [Corynebacterium auris]|uniref:mycothiol synthase n=1 Tax=Corynebacterium auris TaxID=44750 RepID=UPI0025B33646|nr:mycothiol synthase [Corynebacterium auris]WJY68723.1 Mycothiol acetyltransferase [Corynebacterium auris]